MTNAPPQIDDARAFACELANTFVATDDRDTITGNANRTGERHIALTGPDLRIHIRQVERTVGGEELARGQHRAHAGQQFSSIDQSTSPGCGWPLMLGASSLACASSSFRNKRAAGESERAAWVTTPMERATVGLRSLR